jgi:hypothetical protein
LRTLLLTIPLGLLAATAASAVHAEEPSSAPTPQPSQGTDAAVVVPAPTASAQPVPTAPLESRANASRRPWNLRAFVGADYLAASGANGGALSAGLRAGLSRYFAASLDLGYGLLGASPGIEDRWWLLPSVALVVPAGRVSFDFGVGVGVGTVSGYSSWSDYVARPFGPDWHFTVPAVRVHAIVALPLSHELDLFARIEGASLLGVSQSYNADAFWFGLSMGLAIRLL